MLDNFDMKEFISDLTHQEKLLYGELGGVLLAVLVFFIFGLHSLAHSGRIVGWFWLSWLIAWQIPFWHFMVLHFYSGGGRIDERDRHIAQRGSQFAHVILSAGSLLFVIIYGLGWLKGIGSAVAYVGALWLLGRTGRVVRQLELHRTQDGFLGDYLKQRAKSRQEGRLD
jgi:hypothetical protein